MRAPHSPHVRGLGLWLRLLLGFGFALGPLVAAASAQAPKAGDYYEDAVDLGFRVKMPKDWEFTPPQPGERYLVGKYTPAHNRYIYLSPSNPLWLEALILKFDRRESKNEDDADVDGEGDEGEAEPASTEERHRKILSEWLEDRWYGGGYRVTKEKDGKNKDVPSTEFLFEADKNGDTFQVYAMVFELGPKLDVAVVFNGPGDKKWRKYESAAKKMAKTFRVVEVEAVEHSGAKAGESALRSLRRAALEKEAAKSADWQLYETPNYFVISNNEDREFMKEMLERLEAIRAVYEEIYPFDEAARIKVAAQKEAGEDEEKEVDPGDDPLGRGRTTSGYSSRQRSQCSVVRVCKNKTQYHEYGGPGGSAGYWHSGHEELVIYDDKSGGGRRDTWAVLNHEAFHQYIFYLYGSISPHSWYNEGTGDFFAGYEYKHGRFVLKPFAWRKDLIRQAIKDEKHVPLDKLVRFTQREYYGNNDYDVGGGQNYAQGWSFIYFLRTGQGKARGWDDDWNGILDIYFETLAATEDLDESVDKAFEGVDWKAMEESWKAYILD